MAPAAEEPQLSEPNVQDLAAMLALVESDVDATGADMTNKTKQRFIVNLEAAAVNETFFVADKLWMHGYIY